MVRFRWFRSAVFLLGIFSCTEENAGVTVVTTEEVLLASGDEIRLLGRVISDEILSVSDHGFYLSEDANFSTPAIVSLGGKTGPGRFIGSFSSLKVSTTYFAKAFMEQRGAIQFGEVVEVSTLDPALKSFFPTFGISGGELFIEGRNFGAAPRVFFGDQEAIIVENILQSRLTVQIPAPSQEVQVPIRVIVQDQEVRFGDLFEYRVGSYQKISTFPQEIRLYDQLFFQDGMNGFYIGLGSIRGLSFFEGFQRYAPDQAIWEPIAFPGSSRSFAFFTDQYLGGGLQQLGSNPYVYDPSFWAFEQGSFSRLADLPFRSRDAIAFELGADLYVLGTNPAAVPFFFRYSGATAQWELLPTPSRKFTRDDAVFTYQGMGYLIDSEDGNLVRYDPSSGSWSVVGNFPGSTGNGRGMARVLGDKAYIGLFERSDDVWELDLRTFGWKEKNPMPGFPQSTLVGHFTDGQYLYVMRVPVVTLAGNFPMDLYRFDPEGIE